MKMSFNLLVLGNDTDSKIDQLRSVCVQADVSLLNQEELFALPPEELAEQVVLIAGDCNADSLLLLVHRLADARATPVLIVDRLSASAEAVSGVSGFSGSVSGLDSPLAAAFASLAEFRIQTMVAAQVNGLVNSSRLMLYQFAKADSTATIMVVLNAGTSHARVLTITRLHAPYQDEESFPGGFLNPHTESLPGCGAREGSEETSVTVAEAELELLDVRSRPDRDVRGHVVDHGYMWLVPAHRTAEVEASVKAGDDAKPESARFVAVTALLNAGSMAFDHYDLLLAAVRTGKVLPPASFALRLVRGLQNMLNCLARLFERHDSVYERFHR